MMPPVGSIRQQQQQHNKRTFGQLVVIASKKNEAMELGDGRGLKDDSLLRKTVLQKNMWISLQDTFDDCEEKSLLVRFPANTEYNTLSPSPFKVPSSLSVNKSFASSDSSSHQRVQAKVKITAEQQQGINKRPNNHSNNSNNNKSRNNSHKRCVSGHCRYSTSSPPHFMKKRPSAPKPHLIPSVASTRQRSVGVREKHGETILVIPAPPPQYTQQPVFFHNVAYKVM